MLEMRSGRPTVAFAGSGISKMLVRCTEQVSMAYAVFKDGEKISRTFPTQEEALKKAKEAGLMEFSDRPVLEDNLSIKPCLPDAESKSDDDLDWALDRPGPDGVGDSKAGKNDAEISNRCAQDEPD
jgi:hypothetical protein